MPTLHVVDGTFELFRAHFSKRPDVRGADGRSIKATVGLASSMLALLHEPKENVTHIAVAFDNPIRSFRNDLFHGYKSDEGVDPELRAQFDAAEDAVRALGIVVWSMDRWEADDALATAAWRFHRQADVKILSVDKDLGQCLAWTNVIQVDRIRDKVIDADTVREVRGIEPESIPDLLALVGDDADGIPGLPGFGAKGAAAVLRRWKHLDAIPDDAAAWDVDVRGKDKLAATLREMRPQAELYRTLATLVTDVPLREDLDALRFRGVPRNAFTEWCASAGLGSMATRPVRWGE